MNLCDGYIVNVDRRKSGDSRLFGFAEEHTFGFGGIQRKFIGS